MPRVDSVSLFLDLYLPACDPVVLRQVCAGLTDSSTNGGVRPALWTLDLLWLGSCASVYLLVGGNLSANVVFESAAIPFNFLKGIFKNLILILN